MFFRWHAGSLSLLIFAAVDSCLAELEKFTLEDPVSLEEQEVSGLVQLKHHSGSRRRRPPLRAYLAAVNASSPHLPGPRASARSALCFSGGGMRSLSLSMGYYRAFEALGILPESVDAISSVSGGTFASAQYMFANRTSLQLLGPSTQPRLLSMSVLNETPPDMGATATKPTNTLAIKAFASASTECLLQNGLDTEDWLTCMVKLSSRLWIKIVAEAILAPFGLDKDGYMAASQEAVDEIVAQNPSLKRKRWYTPVPGRPTTFVMQGVLGAPVGYASTGENQVSLQMSPDFTGSPFYPNGSPVSYEPAVGSNANEPLSDIWVGGGLVSTFAFGGLAPGHSDSGEVSVPAPDTPFTLSDAVGISSAPNGPAFSALYPTQVANPNGLYWPVSNSTIKVQPAAQHQLFDGGSLDSTGLLAMLQNQATRVVVLFNGNLPLNATMDLCSVTPGTDLNKAAAVDIACLFGYCADGSGESADGSGETFNYTRNQVFSSSTYPSLLCDLQTEVKAGKPAIALKSYTVQANAWWGIQGGWDVTIIWVYKERLADFEELLPAETQIELAKGNLGPFARYPFYETTLQNPPEVFSLHANQVNLLAAQGGYAVLQRKDLFCQLFTCAD